MPGLVLGLLGLKTLFSQYFVLVFDHSLVGLLFDNCGVVVLVYRFLDPVEWGLG